MPFLVLLLAVASCVLPHLLHVTGGNVTMSGAGLPSYSGDLASALEFSAVFLALPATVAVRKYASQSFSDRGVTAA